MSQTTNELRALDDLIERVREAAGDYHCWDGDLGWETVETLQDYRRALAGRHEQAQGGMAWQPIETAPKDGTAIWVAGYAAPYESWNCGVAKWEDDGYSRAGWKAWGTSRFGATGLSQPTHWMPLPEPPTRPTADARQETQG